MPTSWEGGLLGRSILIPIQRQFNLLLHPMVQDGRLYSDIL